MNKSPIQSVYPESGKKHVSAVDSVINMIVDGVLTGQYKPGSKLPTEVQLAEMLAVSKNTVREAIKILVAYGAVEIRRPEGTFIASEFTPRMLNPVIYSLLFSRANAEDFVGLRRMIDTGVFLLIMQQGLRAEDEAALEAMHKRYSAVALAKEPDLDLVSNIDCEFHKLLAAATHNELVRVFHDYVVDLTSASRMRAVQMSYDNNNMQYLVDTHRKTLDLVEHKSAYSLEEVIDFSYFYWKSAYKI